MTEFHEDQAAPLQTSAAAVLTPDFDGALSTTEKARAHSSWAIAAVAIAGFIFFCGAAVYHGLVGEWPMGAVFTTDADDRWGVASGGHQ